MNVKTNLNDKIISLTIYIYVIVSDLNTVNG